MSSPIIQTIQNAKSLSIEEYETIINEAVLYRDTSHYEEKMHTYILNNNEIRQNIESNLKITKKFFNQIIRWDNIHLGLITEAWCLDACIILPLLRAIHTANPNIGIQIYLRDSNEELMNAYLTNGSKSIPIVFGYDDREELFRWGPRSAKAKQLLEPIAHEAYSVKYAALSQFYRSDLTLDIQEEWIDIFRNMSVD